MKKDKDCCGYEPGKICRPDEVIEQPKIIRVNKTTVKNISLRNK